MENNKKTLFTKENYLLIVVGVLTIAVGFILMMGGNRENPEIFNEEVFSFRRIRLAPAVIFVGFTVCILSIFYSRKK